MTIAINQGLLLRKVYYGLGDRIEIKRENIARETSI